MSKKKRDIATNISYQDLALKIRCGEEKDTSKLRKERKKYARKLTLEAMNGSVENDK